MTTDDETTDSAEAAAGVPESVELEGSDAELVEDAAPPPNPEAEGTEVARIPSDGTLLDVPAESLADPGPDPITPGSSQEAYHDRVAYEDLVNKQLESWIESNRGAVLATMLAGGTVELTHNTPDDDADDEPTEVEVERLYTDWSNAELSEECANRGLAKSGTNAELIARLEADDKADGVEPVAKS